jgi:D-lactate dehydrogenase
MEAARQRGDLDLLAELERDYDYEAIQTCAVDGMCQTACPVHINTGDLVRRLRARDAGPVAGKVWKAAAGHWGGVAKAAGVALTAAHALPSPVPTLASKAGRRLLGPEQVPLYDPRLPHGGTSRPALRDDGAEAVYFASCLGTMFGAEGDGEGCGASDAFVLLASRVGVALRTPDGLPSLCCGTPWKSKGHRDGYDVMVAKVLPALAGASDAGRLPVVVDASSCAQGLMTMVARESPGDFTVVDAIDFVATRMLPGLTMTTPLPSLALHPTCASREMGTAAAMEVIGRAIATEVFVPRAWGCCAFAGDRGLLHPELTASATGPEAGELSTRTFAAYASSNRTCEIGMTRATGKPYVHILELLEAATRESGSASATVS